MIGSQISTPYSNVFYLSFNRSGSRTSELDGDVRRTTTNYLSWLRRQHKGIPVCQQFYHMPIWTCRHIQRCHSLRTTLWHLLHMQCQTRLIHVTLLPRHHRDLCPVLTPITSVLRKWQKRLCHYHLLARVTTCHSVLHRKTFSIRRFQVGLRSPWIVRYLRFHISWWHHSTTRCHIILRILIRCTHNFLFIVERNCMKVSKCILNV